MNLSHLFIALSLLALASGQPAQNPRDLLRALNSAASALKPSAPSPTPKPQACTCTVVFGNKASQMIKNASVSSTIGLTGQDKLKKACSADLLVGTGCTSATANESVNSCVTGSTCIIA